MNAALRLPPDEAAAAQPGATGGAGVSASGDPAFYEIRVEGVLDSRWATWFGDLRVEREDTQTVISGPLADRPALHGLLTKIRDLGLCLISVRRLNSDGPETGKSDKKRI
jgi:hypothetical protein